MTGTVAFYDGTTFLGTATLSSSPPNASPTAAISPAVSPASTGDAQVSGQATLPDVTLTVGDHNIRAVYSGDANYAAVTSITPVSVAVQPATTATTLAVGPGAAGTTILTATIVPTSPGTPTLTGTVAFYDGDTLLGTAPVINQVATFNAGVLGVGAHTFRAVFSGGAQSTSSGSSSVVYTPAANGPTVVSIRRFGRNLQPTYVVLTFSGALDPVRAENVRNYQMVKLNRHGKPIGRARPHQAGVDQLGRQHGDAVLRPPAQPDPALPGHGRRLLRERDHGHDRVSRSTPRPPRCRGATPWAS